MEMLNQFLCLVQAAESADNALYTFFDLLQQPALTAETCDEIGMLSDPYQYSIQQHDGTWSGLHEASSDSQWLQVSKPMMYALARELKRRHDCGQIDSRHYVNRFHCSFKVLVMLLFYVRS